MIRSWLEPCQGGTVHCRACQLLGYCREEWFIYLGLGLDIVSYNEAA